jgi:autotransporter translocation and assembly factor TamB
VGENDRSKPRRVRHIWRRVMIGAAVCVALLIVFHGPVLRMIIRKYAIHYAGKQNLKVDFRLEGEPLSHLTIRNLHAVATGPSAIESINMDSLYIDYSLLGWVWHGDAHLLQDVEVRDAQVVLNPANAPPPKPGSKKKVTLPTIFPERLQLTDATLVIRKTPNDFVIQHVDLDLNPRAPGGLRIAKLQLPSGDSWSRISGQASYTDKNFILRNLVLGDQLQIQLLQIDASHIESKALAIKFNCAIGGGKLSGSVALNEAGSSLNVKINLDAEKIATAPLSKFLLLPENYVSGEIDRFALVGAGVLDVPRTWSGTMSLLITDMHLQGVSFDKVAAEVSAGQGKATLQSADVVQNQNELHLQGIVDLPAKVEDLGRTPTNLQVSGKLPDLGQLTAGSSLSLTGSIQFDGKLDIGDTNLQANLGVNGAAIGFPNGTLEKLNATIRASKMIAGRNPQPGSATPATRPWFADLRTAMQFTLTGIRCEDYVIDSAEGSLNGSDDVLGIDRLSVRRDKNALTVHGRYRLPEQLGDALLQPVRVDVAFNAPQAGDFWVADSPNKVSGSLQMTAQIERKQGVTDGRLSITGSNLKMRDLVVQGLSAQASIANNIVNLNEGSATLNDTDFATASGTFDLQPPHHYSGKVSARVANLAVLEPLLRASGNQNQLAGALKLDWDGSGNAQTFKSTGKMNLVVENGRYGNVKGLQANVDSSYSPEGIDVPTISFKTDKMDFQAIARTKGDRLEIDKIQLDQGKARFASGYVSIPFVWTNLGTNAPVIPSSGKVSATAQIENLDVKKLAENLGIKSPISGVLNASLDASGTVADLNARLAVQAQDLRNAQWPKMEPASFELTAQVAQDRLTARGKLQQTRLQPLEISASTPLDVPKIVRARGLPNDTPISVKARLPRSSVNFVRQFVPEIEQLDGELGMDVGVSGTIGRPVFNGAADVKVNVARFNNATIPALRSFGAHLVFASDTLSLQRFSGELAGGSFTAGGRITFPKLTQPTLDLQFRAKSALVARNDTLTMRADADIRISGPLASATVTGNVALTDSHILKNIELIPIGLPGRPPPQPPAATPELSVTTPPLRDWKFDVTITTKNPVEIRGNLATGGATVDLKLAGTGLHPGLQGVVQLKNVEATLPFSRLDVSQGLLTFNPSDPMNPKISLQGRSVIRDYTVRVYVYGTVESPQAIFSSEPPLPQEEIISLIATGATRQELSGTNVLAGRAAMLLVQELYHKIVKKGQPTQSQSSTFFNRMDLELGTVDPRTGEQQATVRFKVNNHLVLVGDVGVRGDFRGRLKYLIRFR